MQMKTAPRKIPGQRADKGNVKRIPWELVKIKITSENIQIKTASEKSLGNARNPTENMQIENSFTDIPGKTC